MAALDCASMNSQDLEQFALKARDLLAHLDRVARAIPDPSKTPGPRTYAFGSQNAAKSGRAIPHAEALSYALQQGDLIGARVAAQEIENQLAPRPIQPKPLATRRCGGP